MNLSYGGGGVEKIGTEGKSGSALPTAPSHDRKPLAHSGAHRLPRCLGGAPGLGAFPLRGDQGQPGLGSRPSLEGTRRPGWGTRPAPPGALAPAESAQRSFALGGRRGRSEGPGCQTSGAFHVGRDDVVQVARIQGGAFFPSGSTHRPSPPTQKRTRTQKLLPHY